jgi:hypothetical protein
MTQKNTSADIAGKIIEAQKELIKELTGELRRIQRKNLKLKMHMQVLAGIPRCRTAGAIREGAGAEPVLSDSILHLN